MKANVQEIISKYSFDKTRLVDIMHEIQEVDRCISKEAIKEIVQYLKISPLDCEEVVSFYHFFSKEHCGKYTIYLNDSAVAEMFNFSEIAEAFQEAVGIPFGTTTEDKEIGLYYTACIGMSDQEPAAIINNIVFTKLTTEKVNTIVAEMKKGTPITAIAQQVHGVSGNDLKALSNVENNIKKTGDILLNPYESGAGLNKTVSISPEEVIKEVKDSAIRGRGGAGFPTGMKWDFCRGYNEPEKYVICNADEGEPGTFKDRVLLTERPEMLFEGMAIGGYAIGAENGILYLRGEYRYLENYLEGVLASMREKGLLGKNINGKEGYNFDIRIQMGAGAYVCGEESALIESCEGKRGEPRIRPPFPVERGYLGKPTIVNNVETFCAVSRILEKTGTWYKGYGTQDSSGTKLLSISGDCAEPGVYEIEWGMSIQEMLDMVGAKDTYAVQVGGPSGVCIDKSQFERKIAYGDLATGGSMIVFNKDRDLLKVAHNFITFFMKESCGACTPCRVGNSILHRKVTDIIRGAGRPMDLDQIKELGVVMKASNRCGLGQTSANPILTTLENFKELYDKLVPTDVNEHPGFDLEAAVQASNNYVGRSYKEETCNG